MTSPDLVKGWCPTALRPMRSGDGLILRVRPRLGILTRQDLEALAAISAKFSDGALHLTNRANVQVRGMREEDHPAAAAALRAAGLLDDRAEALPQIAIAPSASLTRGAGAAQIRASIEEALGSSPRLPAKFGFDVQAGPRVDRQSMGDITLVANAGRVLILLDGAEDWAVSVEAVELSTAIASIIRAFHRVASSSGTVSRMRHAIAALGSAVLFDETGLTPFLHGLQLNSETPSVGALTDLYAYGLGFLFGEIPAQALQEITSLMERQHIELAAISAHRSLVFSLANLEAKTPSPQPSPYGRGSEQQLRQRPLSHRERDRVRGSTAAQTVEDIKLTAANIGAITDPSDPGLRVHACAGAPRCVQASTDVRREARELIGLLRQQPDLKRVVHISGCEKGCAFSGQADITAIGNSGGYDIASRTSSQTGVSAAALPGAVAELARHSR